MSSDGEIYNKVQRDDALDQLERRLVRKELERLLDRLRSVMGKMDNTRHARINIMETLKKINQELQLYEMEFFGEYKMCWDQRIELARQRMSGERN